MAKVLLVEKEEFLQRIYKDILKLKGHTVEVASSVSDALKKVKDFEPDLIVFDLAVSDIPCTDFLKTINTSKDGKTFPVLLLSSSPSTEVKDIGKCLKLGAIGYMDNIGHPKEIIEKIEMILGPLFAGSGSSVGEKTIEI